LQAKTSTSEYNSGDLLWRFMLQNGAQYQDYLVITMVGLLYCPGGAFRYAGTTAKAQAIVDMGNYFPVLVFFKPDIGAYSGTVTATPAQPAIYAYRHGAGEGNFLLQISGHPRRGGQAVFPLSVRRFSTIGEQKQTRGTFQSSLPEDIAGREAGVPGP
jgi:hypothetical protein